MNASEPNYCVTLVHGTFAPNSAWTQEGSVLRETLKGRLDNSVAFSAPDWGGANTQAARQRGAKLIEDVVSKQMEQYPAADHFVIAHSHGGNVALMACCSAQIAAQLKGLVCLATPFLSFRPRRYLLNLRLLAFTAIAYFLLVLMLMVAGGDAERQTSKSTGASGEQLTSVNNPDRGTLRLQGDSLAGFFTGTYPGVTRRFGTTATMIFLALCCTMAVWGSLRLTQKAARKIDQLQERAGERYRTPITAEIGQGRTWSKLRHSLPYESPAVVRAIAEWMKQQAEHPGVKT